MSSYTKEDILEIVEARDVKFIRLQFTDIFGKLKNIAVTVNQLEKVLDNKCMFDGSSIEGFSRIEESDMYLHPDLDTFTIFPWRPQQGSVARLICDIYNIDGTPFEGSPRYVLKKAIKRAEKLGYTFNVGSECEFFLLNTDENGEPTVKTNDKASYFDIAPKDNGENVRRDICLTLEDMGFEIESSHHEVSAAQHEIDFKYNDCLAAADNIMTFKMVVRLMAQRHGLHASFMPKPMEGVDGSGMHINMSLSKDGKNIFSDDNSECGLSPIAMQFMAGVMKNMMGMTAIINPLVNSYKRLVPGFEAPCYIAWTMRNRTSLIRIPASTGEETRIELRSPDPTCNPYLAFAVLLNAGLDGIENNMTPPNIVTGNIFQMTSEERAEKGIVRLPKNLEKAIEEMEKSDFVKDVIGEHIYSRYISSKKEEWSRFEKAITHWELKEYV